MVVDASHADVAVDRQGSGLHARQLAEVDRFVDDTRIPLANNATERGIRGPVVGRRNHFGSKSQRGTEVAATLYTIVETYPSDERSSRMDLSWAIVRAPHGTPRSVVRA